MIFIFSFRGWGRGKMKQLLGRIRSANWSFYCPQASKFAVFISYVIYPYVKTLRKLFAKVCIFILSTLHCTLQWKINMWMFLYLNEKRNHYIIFRIWIQFNFHFHENMFSTFELGYYVNCLVPFKDPFNVKLIFRILKIERLKLFCIEKSSRWEVVEV